jgi:plasmid stability protein
MAALSIRDLDDQVKARLQVRAAQHGRSMEAEVRAILTDAVADTYPGFGLAQALMSRFADLDADDVELPARTLSPRAADLAS